MRTQNLKIKKNRILRACAVVWWLLLLCTALYIALYIARRKLLLLVGLTYMLADFVRILICGVAVRSIAVRSMKYSRNSRMKMDNPQETKNNSNLFKDPQRLHVIRPLSIMLCILRLPKTYVEQGWKYSPVIAEKL
uniref:orf135 n=1 Tax=Podospora anserina TaxID=2587412 RepID=UPI0000166158|nr:orf135 [Podospora anserina]